MQFKAGDRVDIDPHYWETIGLTGPVPTHGELLGLRKTLTRSQKRVWDILAPSGSQWSVPEQHVRLNVIDALARLTR